MEIHLQVNNTNKVPNLNLLQLAGKNTNHTNTWKIPFLLLRQMVVNIIMWKNPRKSIMIMITPPGSTVFTILPEVSDIMHPFTPDILLHMARVFQLDTGGDFLQAIFLWDSIMAGEVDITTPGTMIPGIIIHGTAHLTGAIRITDGAMETLTGQVTTMAGGMAIMPEEGAIIPAVVKLFIPNITMAHETPVEALLLETHQQEVHV